MKTPDKRAPRPSLSLSSDRSRLVALAAFCVLVMFTGGSSRPDIMSLALLRPLAFGFLAYALLTGREDQFRLVRVPLVLLVCFAALMASQLVPLPPGVWASLPAHEDYARAAEAAGLVPAWRPLSLSPGRTLNALLALGVIVAGVCLTAIQPRRQEDYLVYLIVAAGTLSAFWAILQLSGIADALYLYHVTNEGAAVGLLANRNHQAVLLGAVLPFLAHLLRARARASSKSNGSGVILLAVALLLIFVSLSTGSRAGFFAVGAGLAVSCAVLVGRLGAEDPVGNRRKIFRRGMVVTLAGALVLALAPLLLGRTLVLERLLATDPIEEIRFAILPQALRMIADSFPTGLGFGTFEFVYYKYEPFAALSRYYVNHAHNDWVELVLDGGLPAALLLAGFLAWLARKALSVARSADRGATWSRDVACLGFIAISGLASLVDYPLRTPIVGVLFVMCCAILARSSARGLRDRD